MCIKSEGALWRRGVSPGALPLLSFSQPGRGKGLLQSIPSDTWISTASRVPGESVESLSAPHCTVTALRPCSSFSLLCRSWNPNLNNPGMVRLPNLSARKTGSILCTYPVVLLKMLLGGWNPDTVDVESKGFFSFVVWFLGSLQHYLLPVLIEFSFGVI